MGYCALQVADILEATNLELDVIRAALQPLLRARLVTSRDGSADGGPAKRRAGAPTIGLDTMLLLESSFTSKRMKLNLSATKPVQRAKESVQVWFPAPQRPRGR